MVDQPHSATATADVAAANAAAPARQRRSGMARLRLALLASAAALVLLVAVLVIAAWSAWRSDVSLPWLLRQVPGLQTQGVSGSLAGGDLTIQSLDWEISPGGGRLHVDDLVLRGVSIWLRRQPRLAGDVSMTSATARSVTFHSGPAPTTAATPPSHLRLPVSLQIDQLRVQLLQIDQAPVVRELSAHVQLGADRGNLHRVDQLRALVEQAELSGQFQIGAEAPLPVSGQIRARQIPQAQPEPSTAGPAWAGQAWAGQAQLSNTLANLKLALQVQGTAAAGQPAPNLQAQAGVQPWAAWPLGDLRLSAEHFDLASLSAQLPQTAISGQAQVTTQGLDQLAQAEVQLHNAQAGRLDLGRLPVRELTLNLAAAPNLALHADRRQVVLRRFEMQLGDLTQAAGLASGSGQWHAGVLDLALVLTGVLPAKLDDRLAVVKLSGPLKLRWNASTVASTGQAVTPIAPITPARAAKADTPANAASPAIPVPPDQSPGATAGASLPWQLSGRLDGQALSPQGAALRLEFDAAASATHLVVRQARASAGQGRASFSGSARLDGAGDAARPTRPSSWQVVGRSQFDDFDPLPWWRGASASVWRTGGHRLDGELTTDLHWRTGPVPGAPAGALPGALTGVLTGKQNGVNASATAPWLNRLDGWVQAKLGRSLLAGVPLTGQARLERRDGVATLQAALQSGASTVDLSAGRDAGLAARERATLSLKSPDLATLAPLMRQIEAWLPGSIGALPSAGQVDARAEIDNQASSLRSSGRLQAKGLISPLGQAGALDLNWQAGWAKSADGSLRPGDEPLTLNLRATALARGAQRLDRLDVDLSGSLAEHRLQALVESPARPPGWTEVLFGPAGSGTRLELDGRGSWRSAAAGSQRWVAQGVQLRAAARRERDPAKPWLRAQDLAGELDLSATGLPTALRLSPGRVEVLNTALRWSQAEWRARAPSNPASPQLDLVGELETLDVASLLRRVQPNVGWSGNLSLGGRIEIHSGERLSADVLLDRRGGDLQVTDDLGGVQALGLTDLRLSLGVHDGVWQFAQGLSGTQVGEMAGAQVVRTTPGQHWPPANAPLQGVIQARVAKLEVWGHWVPPGWRLTGALQTSASFGGTFGAPEYSGRMQGQGLGLRNLIEGVSLSDGELDLTLAGDRARVERFSFRGGEGRLDLTGEATLGSAPSARLALVASRFRLLGRIDRRVVVSGQTRLQLDANQLKLDGRVSIDEGLIDWTQGDAPGLDSDVVITPRADVQSRAQSNAQSERSDLRNDPRTDPRTLPAALRNAQVAVTIALGERLRLRGRGLDTGLQGELRISSPGGRLSLDGAVKAVGGTYAAYGQKLEITRGDITFASTVNNPRLDVLAIRPNLDVVVGVAITGSALQPRIRLVSQPEMAELDKLSWLVLGRSPDGLGRTDTALLQRAAIALLAGEGKAPTDELLSKLGLTDFSLRQTDGDVRETIISLGRQLSRRWYVGYERSLSATNGTWQLVYRIAQRFTLRAQSGAENALDLIWSWRWN